MPVSPLVVQNLLSFKRIEPFTSSGSMAAQLKAGDSPYPSSSSKVLVPNGVYAALSATEEIGYFHWMICLAIDERSVFKFHATNDQGRSPWRYEIQHWANALHDPMSITFTRIGLVDDGLNYEALNMYLETIPIDLVPEVDRPREPRFSSLTWFREAVRRLHDAGLFVKCPSVDALEEWLIATSTAAEYQDGLVADLPLLLETKLAAPWEF